MGSFPVQFCHQMSGKQFLCSCFCSVTPSVTMENIVLEWEYWMQVERDPSYGLEHTPGPSRLWQWWKVHKNLISYLILLLHGQSEMLIICFFFFSLLPHELILWKLFITHSHLSLCRILGFLRCKIYLDCETLRSDWVPNMALWLLPSPQIRILVSMLTSKNRNSSLQITVRLQWNVWSTSSVLLHLSSCREWGGKNRKNSSPIPDCELAVSGRILAFLFISCSTWHQACWKYWVCLSQRGKRSCAGHSRAHWKSFKLELKGEKKKTRITRDKPGTMPVF